LTVLWLAGDRDHPGTYRLDEEKRLVEEIVWKEQSMQRSSISS
jgi:hypothetical protein